MDIRPRWHALLILSVLTTVAASDDNVTPLPQAHAHNDYYHKRPLLDALAHGFCNVEADVFLVDGKLLVAHSRFELRPEKTLEKLYLDPLLQRVRDNAKAGQEPARVFPNGPTLTLLIDFKTNGSGIYRQLQKVLPRYREILSRFENGTFIPGAVTLVISGDRPRELISKSNPRYVGIDGRVSDLGSQDPAHLLPLISDRWSTHFRWRGLGPMPDAERQKLNQIVQLAHKSGRRVRFWATPELPSVWQVLLNAKVDLINTDKLDELESFLSRPSPVESP